MWARTQSSLVLHDQEDQSAEEDAVTDGGRLQTDPDILRHADKTGGLRSTEDDQRYQKARDLSAGSITEKVT